MEQTGPAASEPAVSGERRIGPLVLVCCLVGLESAVYLRFSTGRLTLANYIYLHFGLCGISAALGCGWAFGSSTATQARERAAAAIQLVTWTMLAGPFGTLLAAALLLPRVGDNRPEHALRAPPAPGEAPVLTRPERLHHALLDRRVRVEHASSVRPLLDVVAGGIQAEKFEALRLISKRYVPALAPALKRALEDKDGSVRVLAAKVTAQQHDTYTNRIGALQAKVAATPGMSFLWEELGQIHRDYAESGLLDRSRADAQATQAKTCLDRAKQLDPAAA